ncbi:hypothetical protein EDD16DRAFT_1521231 [Pisolithus croceorrhizus]|nr:hypothetical protein EDD16DRAFT_1521231 [Pisolithus croceorrhizus]
MEWDGATHGRASATNEAGWHASLAGPSIIRNESVQRMDGPGQRYEVSQHNLYDGPVHDMEQDVVTNGLSRTTNDTGWDIPWAGPLLLKKEAVQLVGGPAKAMIFSSTTYKLAQSAIWSGTAQPMGGPVR